MPKPPARSKPGPKPPSAADTALVRDFGERVVAAREAAKMTQEQLASGAAVSTRYVQRLEAGDLNPTFTKIVALSRALGRHGRALMRVE